jgi:hypothetical protein
MCVYICVHFSFIRLSLSKPRPTIEELLRIIRFGDNLESQCTASQNFEFCSQSICQVKDDFNIGANLGIAMNPSSERGKHY